MEVVAPALETEANTWSVVVPVGRARAVGRRAEGRAIGRTSGEVNLQGKVLPIGVKQKLLAPHRVGLTQVILPYRNEADLGDVPESVRKAMTIRLAKDEREVLEHALERKAAGLPEAA